ncbi:MAG: glycosyltransferase [Bacteroidetes bacterium]|nr:MAG: glycosyltransferase [Bacteroidota bacterium]
MAEDILVLGYFSLYQCVVCCPILFVLKQLTLTPEFSIIIPTYNRANRVRESIESVLNQTCKNWELIVVDDGSTDNTKEICQRFKDQRITYLYQENAERSAARNRGIAKAVGKYIGFLDSDDVYAPSFLEEVQALTQNTHIPSLIFTGLSTNHGGGVIPQPIPAAGHLAFADFLLIHSMATPRAVIHRECFQKGLFPKDFSIGEDRHLWVRLATYFPVLFCPKAIVIQNDYGDRSIASLPAVKENYLSLCAAIQSEEGKTLARKSVSIAKGRALLVISRWHIVNENRGGGIVYAIRSLWVSPVDQVKFKVSLLLRLVLGCQLKSIATLF